VVLPSVATSEEQETGRGGGRTGGRSGDAWLPLLAERRACRAGQVGIGRFYGTGKRHPPWRREALKGHLKGRKWKCLSIIHTARPSMIDAGGAAPHASNGSRRQRRSCGAVKRVAAKVPARQIRAAATAGE
jgi:hypothetical protein